MPTQPAPSLNLIGPGRLGRTLARLWLDRGLVRIAAIVARQPAHVADAIRFIGAGEAGTLPDLPPAAITLIATPDDAIAAVASQLAAQAQPGQVYFHCSGALASTALTPLRDTGTHVASVHPLKSFATPEHAITDFAGTYCSTEGDPAALAVLAPLFAALGAKLFPLDASAKTLYHAAAVLACNDLVALMEGALRTMEAAGVARATAWAALRPLIGGTLDNLDRMDTRAALTGPVARGDVATVARQATALKAEDEQVAAIYRALGDMAVQLAPLDDAQRARMRDALQGSA